MNEMISKLDPKDEIAAAPSGLVIAVIEGEDGDGRPLLRWGKGRRKPRPARVAWMPSPPQWSTCKGLRAIAGFEDGDPEKPILLGLLDSPPLEEDNFADPTIKVEPTSERKPKVLRIESTRELVLECGKAKIALRADGRVVILGGYVLSRSKGVNKIKGGSVHIN